MRGREGERGRGTGGRGRERGGGRKGESKGEGGEIECHIFPPPTIHPYTQVAREERRGKEWEGGRRLGRREVSEQRVEGEREGGKE